MRNRSHQELTSVITELFENHFTNFQLPSPLVQKVFKQWSVDQDLLIYVFTLL